MRVVVDLTAKPFGRLTVICRVENSTTRKGARWLCSCSCGGSSVVFSDCLRNGITKSCGCLKTIHGEAGRKTREYQAWRDMKNRCYNQNHPHFYNWGGRGISVCDKWRNDYTAFLSDIGRCPKGKSLDRKNNNGNYEPGNCWWATYSQQNYNTRRSRGGTCGS